MTASGDMRVGMAGMFAILMAFPLAAAGGEIIPPLIALCALIAFPVSRGFWQTEHFPWPLIPALLFLFWVGLSFLWSPHDNPEQIPKTLLGVPLYMIFALQVGKLSGRWKVRAESAFIFVVLALGFTLFAEMLTDGAATRSFKIAVEGYPSSQERELTTHTYRSLGHAAAPLVMWAGPVALLAWRDGGPIIGGLLIALAGLAAFSFETQVNALAYVFALAASGLAVFAPRTAIAIVFGVVAGLVVVLPLILPSMIAIMPEALRESLPLSWQWRLNIWSYVGELIQQRPWVGFGLDASRPLNAEAELAGYTIERLPQHPHNATLQIWLETGFVGAILLASALLGFGDRIANAPQLSRIQAVAVVWVLVSYVSLVVFSYGVWQEWHQGAAALGVTAVLFLGARKPV